MITWKDKKKDLKSLNKEELEELDQYSELICKIINKRIEKNISIDDFAKMLKIDSFILNKIETGEFKLPYEDLLKFLDTLN